MIKNSQPFWKKCQKTLGGYFFDSHCIQAVRNWSHSINEIIFSGVILSSDVFEAKVTTPVAADTSNAHDSVVSRTTLYATARLGWSLSMAATLVTTSPGRLRAPVRRRPLIGCELSDVTWASGSRDVWLVACIGRKTGGRLLPESISTNNVATRTHHNKTLEIYSYAHDTRSRNLYLKLAQVFWVCWSVHTCDAR